MQKTTTVICIILIISIAKLGLAGNLSLNQVLELAKEKSKDLKLAKAELEIAQENISEAWASALPNIQTDVNYSRNLKEQFFYINNDNLPEEQRKLSFTFKNQYSVSTKLEQTIYSFGKVGTALEIAYDFENYAEMNYNYKRRQILTSTRVAFYRVLLMKEISKVAGDSEESSKSNYLETKTKYESGVASEYEMLQSEVRWRNSIPATIAANKNYLQALNALKSILNMPLREALELDGTLLELPPMPERQDRQQVLVSREDFKAIQLEGVMREKNVDIEFANHLPTLTGDFTYSYSGQSDAFKIENDFDNYVVGLRLNIPIYSGGFTSAQVQKARIESFKTHTRIAQAKDKIETDLDNTWLDLKEAKERVVASEKNISTARRAFEIAELRWNSGRATQLELKDSRLFLDQAQIDNLRARFDYLKAFYEWQLVTGTGARI